LTPESVGTEKGVTCGQGRGGKGREEGKNLPSLPRKKRLDGPCEAAVKRVLDD